jgi:DNA-binding CsgD family transcriptional regulator
VLSNSLSRPNHELVRTSHEPTSIDLALTHPAQFMHFLAEAIQDEIAFYSHDLDGRIKYLSKSAEEVLRVSPKQILDRPFNELLSENSCNEDIRRNEWDGDKPLQGRSGICEFRGEENGSPFKVKYWRVPIVIKEKPIGYSGILRKLDVTPVAMEIVESADLHELMSRVDRLTLVEFQVVEMVVDGHMNKEAATRLGVAVRTIESRRSRAMLKLKANGLSELVQLWILVRKLLSSGKYSQVSAKFQSVSTASPQTK